MVPLGFYEMLLEMTLVVTYFGVGIRFALDDDVPLLSSIGIMLWEEFFKKKHS
jgi:hypothetical protein